jgi:hypothetical protein
MGNTTAVFGAHEKQSAAVFQLHRARVKNCVNWIRPMIGRNYGIALVPLE